MDSKIRDFFIKAAVDGATKNEIITILGDKKLADATDEQLSQICEVAKKLGVDITIEEIKAFANGGVVLDDSELESVAGGWDELGRPTSLADWYNLAFQVNRAYMKDDDAFGEMLEKIAAEHNISERDLVEAIDLFDNWAAFFS